MIRFNCANCGRAHEVHEALAMLPLVCRQCGQRITPPKPDPNQPPLPPAFAATPPVAAPVVPQAPPLPIQKPPPIPAAVPDSLSEEIPPVHPDGSREQRKSLTAAASEARPEPKSERKQVPVAADIAVFAGLVVVGIVVGELLTGKSMFEVLSESGSAPKFPPVDLVLGFAPPVALVLSYLLLKSRGWSVSAWLRRRSGDDSVRG